MKVCMTCSNKLYNDSKSQCWQCNKLAEIQDRQDQIFNSIRDIQEQIGYLNKNSKFDHMMGK